MDRRKFLLVSGHGLGVAGLGALAGCAAAPEASKAGGGAFDPGPYTVGDELLVFDEDSEAFALDPFGHQVHHREDALGGGRFGSLGEEGGELNHPVAAEIAGDHLFVLDRGNGRVQVYDRGGRHLASICEGMNMPGGLDVEGDRLYVCDTLGHQVGVYGFDGRQLGTIQGPDGDELNGPSGVAADLDGNLHVADSGNARMCVFSPDGQLLGTYGNHGTGSGEMLAPRSVAVAYDGRVFVTDPSAGLVHVFAPDGEFLGRFVPLDSRGEPVVPVRITRKHDGGLHIWTAGHEAAPGVSA